MQVGSSALDASAWYANESGVLRAAADVQYLQAVNGECNKHQRLTTAKHDQAGDVQVFEL